MVFSLYKNIYKFVNMVFSLYKNIYKFVNLLKIQIINLKVIIKIIISEIIVLIGDTIHDNQKIDGITFVKNEFIK
ncbi:hypothetical protein [Spiroplasma citri]|uniref:Plectrovirus-related protein n=3 Tax=Spiroplasma TaxID=2132 RepID=A0AAX3T0W8_SPICI|nr:hypothetical protein [Spiroplasma citri]APE74716.1 plectrovirus-related protein [Spiroplasma citri]WFG97214.1 hypothetical protein M0C40_04240 [Spiroplasma citri]WFG99164.1 hypothetical protein M1770_04195 [Spiroplasma citri]